MKKIGQDSKMPRVKELKSEPSVDIDDSVDNFVNNIPSVGETDTAYALVEIYEAIERSYRAAALAGLSKSWVSHSTNH